MSLGKDSSEQTTAPSAIDKNQSKYLNKLWAGSQPALATANENIAQLQPGMNEALQRLLNPGINPQLGAYADEVNRNFSDVIMPQIQGAAGQANAIGGSRQGVAQGVAAGYANQDITNMASSLYGDDMNRVLAALGIAPDVAGAAQSPYLTQGAILGNPAIIGGGGSGSSKGFNIGLS